MSSTCDCKSSTCHRHSTSHRHVIASHRHVIAQEADTHMRHVLCDYMSHKRPTHTCKCPQPARGQQVQRLDSRHQRHRRQSNLTRCSARDSAREVQCKRQTQQVKGGRDTAGHNRSRVVEIEIDTASCVHMLLVCHMLD